jgi:hypothetical protein
MARSKRATARATPPASTPGPAGATRFGWPRPARVQKFTSLLQQPSAISTHHRIEFQGRVISLPVLTVSLDLPKYRLENGRTCALQAEHLARNPSVRADLFTGDPELADAQEAQHELLLSVAHQSGLREHFEDTARRQTDYLILDEAGFVVNGNRRLATWRDLVHTDGASYGHFHNVDVVVLPHCDDRDIDRLEARLQVEKDIRANYTWDALASMIKRHQDRNGLGLADVAALYGMQERDVRTLLDMLAYADDYLRSRGKTNQWSTVKGDEYAFRTLVTSRDRVRGVGNKEVFKQAVFTLIDNPDEAGGRLYGSVKDIADNIDVVRGRLQSHFNVTPPAPTPAVQDLFGGVPSAGGSGTPDSAEVEAIALAAHIQQSSNAAAARAVIVDAVESQRQLRRDASNAQTLIRKCTEAHTKLAEAARTALTPDSTTEGVENQLQQIEALITTIRAFITSHAAS